MKRLLLFRHAKSDGYSPTHSDFDRPLNRRGFSDASTMAHVLNHQFFDPKVPDKVMVSSALRTRQTWARINDQLVDRADMALCDVEFSDRLYEVSLQSLFTQISSTDAAIDYLMILGHNPGLASLLYYLCPDAPLLNNGKCMTTANAALITLETAWADLHPDACQFKKIVRPKDVA